MINKMLIYLSYNSGRIITILFFISLIGLAVLSFFSKSPIPKVVGFIFFFISGLYVGSWLYKEAMEFIASEKAKGNDYLQKLVDNWRKKNNLQ
jgi:Na+/phosphate symporter